MIRSLSGLFAKTTNHPSAIGCGDAEPSCTRGGKRALESNGVSGEGRGEISQMPEEVQTESLSVTENYAAWVSVDPDGEVTYHIELGTITVHLFPEEWDDIVTLIRDQQVQAEASPVIERYAVWASEDADGDLLYNLEVGEATLYFAEDEWVEVVELLHAAAQQASKRRS